MQQIARKLQDKEKERYDRKRQEREIAKHRKVLQREQAESAGNVLVGRMETQGGMYQLPNFDIRVKIASFFVFSMVCCVAIIE